jgi:Amt family ammonium transporter
VLSVLAQCLGIAGLVTLLWWSFGYSLVFGKGFNNGFLGGAEHFFLNGVTSSPNSDYSFWVSENVYAMYQLMFAIITPALIVGAIAERMKYTALMTFMFFWMFIGPRLGYKREPLAPHSVVLTMIGTGMLWVGWYGFNAGSAVAADRIAANAFTATTLATATAAFVWALLEKILRGKASVLGYCTGAVAGLVVITPACGFVDSTGAIIIGVFAAVIPYVAVSVLKPRLGYDDALDTFGVHAIGGTIGALLTGLLATKQANPNLRDDLLSSLFVSQLAAVGVTLVLSVVGTAVIAFALKFAMGLRPTAEVETAGLDISEHGEEAYIS